MRVMLIIVSFFFLFQPNFAQNIYWGQVKNERTKENLQYVNIGIIAKNIGTVTNEEGEFKIELNPSFDKDSIRVSMIGFKSKIYKVSDFKKMFDARKVLIELKEDSFLLHEVVIRESKKTKTKILGNTTETKNVIAGFGSNQLGTEVGIRIKIRKSPTRLKKFNTYIVNNAYDTLVFRINVYNIKNEMPDQKLLKENIIITTTIKSGKLTIDLTPYNIIVFGDFVISLEWIKDLGNTNELQFSASILRGNIYFRKTSDCNWIKESIIGIGFNVEAEY